MFKLVFDNGKPATETFNTKTELKTRLDELKILYDNEDFPFFDVFIYENDNDITEQVFNEIEQENTK